MSPHHFLGPLLAARLPTSLPLPSMRELALLPLTAPAHEFASVACAFNHNTTQPEAAGPAPAGRLECCGALVLVVFLPHLQLLLRRLSTQLLGSSLQE